MSREEIKKLLIWLDKYGEIRYREGEDDFLIDEYIQHMRNEKLKELGI